MLISHAQYKHTLEFHILLILCKGCPKSVSIAILNLCREKRKKNTKHNNWLVMGLIFKNFNSNHINENVNNPVVYTSKSRTENKEAQA